MAEKTSRLDNESWLASCDPVWARLRDEAEAIAASDQGLAAFVFETVLSQETLEAAVAHRVSTLLGHEGLSARVITHAYRDAVAAEPEIGEAMRADIAAIYDRDPACNRFIEPVLYFKGFHAIQTYRLGHWLWQSGRRDLSLFLQSRASSVFNVDIHPAAIIGRGIMFDHATGIVVGETAVIEDEVSMLHNVTLGGTGKEGGDRHPKVRHGVLIGAGAKILGNIEIGRCSRVAAGSVVLKDVPANTTVAGVPAKVVGEAGCAEPARSMDHMFAGRET